MNGPHGIPYEELGMFQKEAENTMNDTPRTDAVWKDKSQNILEHARTLERELAAITAERDALKTDKERLDWLHGKSQMGCGGWVARPSTTGRGFRLHQDVGSFFDVRAAIDDARKETK